MQDKASPRVIDTAAQARPDGLTPAEAATQKKLKAIVLGLGLLIMLAFAAVIAGMVFRASQIGKVSGSLAPGSKVVGGAVGGAAPAVSGPPALGGSRSAATPFMPAVKLPLPSGSAIKSANLHGSSLVVQHEGPAGAGITIVDMISGQVVSRVAVEISPGRQ